MYRTIWRMAAHGVVDNGHDRASSMTCGCSPEEANLQFDYVIASRGFHEQVAVRALNRADEWGVSGLLPAADRAPHEMRIWPGSVARAAYRVLADGGGASGSVRAAARGASNTSSMSRAQ